MNQLGDILDDPSINLDEVVAILDSYDFNSAADQELDEDPSDQSAMQFLNSVEIEDALISGQVMSIEPAEARPALDTSTQLSRLPGRTELPVAPVTTDLELIERGRVRERVIRLRGVVKELENQLGMLSVLNHRGPDLDDGTEPDSEHQPSTLNCRAQNTGGVVTWRHVAITQYEARRKAERENSNLRQRLEQQIRVAKRLEILIRGQLPDKVRITRCNSRYSINTSQKLLSNDSVLPWQVYTWQDEL